MTDEPELRWTGEVRTLRLQRGDILVVQVPDYLTTEQTEHLRAFVKQKVPANDVMVLGGGMSLVRLIADASARDVEDTVQRISTRIETAKTEAAVAMDGTLKEETLAIRDEIRRLHR
jgi:hypothetical protein